MGGRLHDRLIGKNRELADGAQRSRQFPIVSKIYDRAFFVDSRFQLALWKQGLSDCWRVYAFVKSRRLFVEQHGIRQLCYCPTHWRMYIA
jgi:hypothetical protein